jgi:hypothetical protein
VDAEALLKAGRPDRSATGTKQVDGVGSGLPVVV